MSLYIRVQHSTVDFIKIEFKAFWFNAIAYERLSAETTRVSGPWAKLQFVS